MEKITDVDKRLLLLWKEKLNDVSSLTQRGWLFLEDSDWDKGSECFDRALDLYPQCITAYNGKLCAALKINREGELENYEKAKSEEYQKALEVQKQMKEERLRLYYEDVYCRT